MVGADRDPKALREHERFALIALEGLHRLPEDPQQLQAA
jgi:hypothetical protein